MLSFFFLMQPLWKSSALPHQSSPRFGMEMTLTTLSSCTLPFALLQFSRFFGLYGLSYCCKNCCYSKSQHKCEKLTRPWMRSRLLCHSVFTWLKMSHPSHFVLAKTWKGHGSLRSHKSLEKYKVRKLSTLSLLGRTSTLTQWGIREGRPFSKRHVEGW